jgi:hypothetical protein
MTPCGNSFFLYEIEASDLVQAPDMVRVGMGDQYSIQARNPVPEGLLPKIRGNIDQQTLPPDSHPD